MNTFSPLHKPPRDHKKNIEKMELQMTSGNEWPEKGKKKKVYIRIYRCLDVVLRSRFSSSVEEADRRYRDKQQLAVVADICFSVSRLAPSPGVVD